MYVRTGIPDLFVVVSLGVEKEKPRGVRVPLGQPGINPGQVREREREILALDGGKAVGWGWGGVGRRTNVKRSARAFCV